MRILLIVFTVLVFSGCTTTRPKEPDAVKIMAGVEYLKRDVPEEIKLSKIQLPSLKECGEFLCLSNIDWKKMEFEIQKVREKLFLRHEADKSRNRAYNELVETLGKEQVAYAYSIYRNDMLTEEVQTLWFTSTFQKWTERLGFGLIVCFATGACL